jgi:tRNA-dihydrouridine synthase
MKLICAPMATLSHPAFRILIEKFGGCDEYYTEMIVYTKEIKWRNTVRS